MPVFDLEGLDFMGFYGIFLDFMGFYGVLRDCLDFFFVGPSYFTKFVNFFSSREDLEKTDKYLGYTIVLEPFQ